VDSLAITRASARAAAVIVCLGLLAGGCRPQEAVDPAEQVRVGWDRYRMGEFNQAVIAFESVVPVTTTNNPLHRRALYGLATTWNLRRPGQDPERAIELYRRVIESAPQSEEAAWSMLGLARMKHLVPVGQEPDYNAVRKAYQQVIDRFPKHLAGQEAFLYKQSTLVATLRPQDSRQAMSAIQQFIRLHPDSQFLSPLYRLMAECALILGEPEKRLEAELKALETSEIDQTNPNMNYTWTYWNLATIAEFEVGDFQTARKYYKLLMKEYPKDVRIHAARKALKRMDALETKIRAGLARSRPSPGGGGGT